jgi:hypothetical protein
MIHHDTIPTRVVNQVQIHVGTSLLVLDSEGVCNSFGQCDLPQKSVEKGNYEEQVHFTVCDLSIVWRLNEHDMFEERKRNVST